ncbi:hypothetical protein [Emticicia agri]|uniref:Uncharacterized protein n=1 Tax=Emticicia agri TaxID=2492393 RepID=A0A4Q5LT73_9BACT|nr:hypothetical protein [Emticicia agri]RYU92715.1 hypothetical protein EWM59_25755 [Emticicia agri]
MDLTLLEYVKRIAIKSDLIYSEKFHPLFLNFQKKINDSEYFGLKKEDIFFSETASWKRQLENERSILLLQIGNEKLRDILKKIEFYSIMLDLNTDASKDINERYNHFINPTPNDFTEADMRPMSSDSNEFEKDMQRISLLNDKFSLFIKLVSQELLLLSFQKEYFEKMKSMKTSFSNEVQTKEPGKEFTKARQVLAIYYLLEVLGFEAEFKNKTDVAHLIHLLGAVDLP